MAILNCKYEITKGVNKQGEPERGAAPLKNIPPFPLPIPKGRGSGGWVTTVFARSVATKQS